MDRLVTASRSDAGRTVSVADPPRARLRQWGSTPEFDLARASTPPTCIFPAGVTHRRARPVCQRRRLLDRRDDVEGRGTPGRPGFQCAQIELEWIHAVGAGV